MSLEPRDPSIITDGLHYNGEAIDVGSVSIRLATAADQEVINHYNAVASYGARDDVVIDQRRTDLLMSLPHIAAYSENFGRPGDIGFIATDVTSRPIGAVWGRLYDRPVGDPLEAYPFEITIAVDKSSRGLHVGSRLLDSVIGEAKQVGLSHISLGVSIGNPDARRLYESRGWKALVDAQGQELMVGGEYVTMVLDTTLRT